MRGEDESSGVEGTGRGSQEGKWAENRKKTQR